MAGSEQKSVISELDFHSWQRPVSVMRAYIDTAYGQIHFRKSILEQESGSTPLVCIHSDFDSSRMFDFILHTMGYDRSVFAPDLPGFGDSDSLSNVVGIESLAAVMAAFVDGLGLDSVDLLGYHIGSKVCVELARQCPHRVRRLVLISAPIRTNAELALKESLRLASEIQFDGSHLLNLWTFIRQHSKCETPLIVTHRALAESLKAGEHAWAQRHASIEYCLGESLPKIEHPVLVFNPRDHLFEMTRRAGSFLKRGNLINKPQWANGFIDMYGAEIARELQLFLGKAAKNQRRHGAGSAQVNIVVTERKSSPIRKLFINAQKRLLHLRLAGDPKSSCRPLILLHMSPNSGVIYELFQGLMSKDRFVVAPDTPGFGESDAPLFPPSIENYAECIEELIDHFHISEVDIMGYHTGSQIAVEVALKKPQAVKHIVMVSAPLYTLGERAVRHARNLPLFVRSDGVHLSERFSGLWKFYGSNVPDKIIARNFCASLRGGPSSWWGHRAAFT